MTKSASSPPPKQDKGDLPANLIQEVRRELIEAQLVILDLNDRILQAETDRGDAVSLLGQAELVLEQKIGHIMELDRVLNLKIVELQEKLGKQGSALMASRDKETAATLTIEELTHAQNELVKKIDQANQEIGRLHELAGKVHEELATARENLASSQRELEAHREKATQHEKELRAECQDASNRWHQAEQIRETTQSQLDRSLEEQSKLEAELATMKDSWVWRWSRPLRSLFGPKP